MLIILMKAKPLNTRNIKKVKDILYEQYGFSEDLPYIFFLTESDKLYIVSEDFKKVGIEQNFVNSMGLYFAKYEKEGIRPSIEGSQIIGKFSNKNIIDLTEEQYKEWMRGEDVYIEGDFGRFPLMKYKDDFMGSGIFKENKVLNHIPKTRRIN